MPATTITLLQAIPAQEATDYGIAAGSNVAGSVVSIDQQNAENLVHQGLASWDNDPQDEAHELNSSRGLIAVMVVAAHAAVAATSSLVSTVYDLGEEHSYDNIRTFAVLNQTGTVKIEHSVDGVNFFTVVAATALTAGTPALVEEKVASRFVRCTVANTAASAGVADVSVSFTHLNAAA